MGITTMWGPLPAALMEAWLGRGLQRPQRAVDFTEVSSSWFGSPPSLAGHRLELFCTTPWHPLHQTSNSTYHCAQSGDLRSKALSTVYRPQHHTDSRYSQSAGTMGSFKKEKARKERDGTTGDGMANVRMKGENFYRDAKKVKKLNILKEGKAQRNASGKITKAASYQSRDKPKAVIEPNRKWFGNTRVISQDALNAFRGAVEAQQADPYSYLLRQNKLPMSLIRDTTTKNGVKQHAAKMTVETSPFSDTFGPKAQRKRVKLGVSSLQDLAGESVKMHDDYLDRLEQAKLLSGNSGAGAQEDDGTNADGTLTSAIEPVFSKGQSKRIWNELYKVIDSSDVILHVLDARDPEGTRCRSVEKYIATEAPHKHLVFILNKVDLVPSKVAVSSPLSPRLTLVIPSLSQGPFLHSLQPNGRPPVTTLGYRSRARRSLPSWQWS